MTRAAAIAHQPAARTAAPGWHRQISDLPREHSHEPLAVEGRVPASLRGTLYRNGPGLFSSFGRRYDHLFDGDGAVSAVRFDGGSVTGAARVVESAALQEERRAGRSLYGGYGTIQPGLLNRLRGRFKNAANTSVLAWNGRLLALWEAGLPTELSPEDLSTLGETDLDGVVAGTFSAHPTPVASRDRLYNFGVRYGRHTLLDLYELAPAGSARKLATLPLPGPSMIHDFVATDRHLVFLVPPLRMRVVRAMLGLASFADSLAWKPELGTEVIIVPIDNPANPVRFTTDPFYTWHYSNAFEDGDGRIVVDLVRYDDFASNAALEEMVDGRADTGGLDGTFHRLTIDPARSSLSTEERFSRSCEFPRVAPGTEGRGYRYAYLAARSPGSPGGLQNAIVKLDVETGAARELVLPEGQYTSEPVFVPAAASGAEDDGHVLAHIYDAASHRSCAVVLDARDLEHGPLARAWFDHHLPPSFHGVWAPA